MIKIRLSRLGSKGNVFYRIVCVDKKRKSGGKAIETIGYWNPVKLEKIINKEKLKYWKEKGAVVTKALENLLKSEK